MRLTEEQLQNYCKKEDLTNFELGMVKELMEYKAAIKIIKEKEVNTNVLFSTFDWWKKGEEERSLEVYNRNRTDEEFNSTSLTLEEYKLLYEVLG